MCAARSGRRHRRGCDGSGTGRRVCRQLDSPTHHPRVPWPCQDGSVLSSRLKAAAEPWGRVLGQPGSWQLGVGPGALAGETGGLQLPSACWPVLGGLGRSRQLFSACLIPAVNVQTRSSRRQSLSCCDLTWATPLLQIGVCRGGSATLTSASQTSAPLCSLISLVVGPLGLRQTPSFRPQTQCSPCLEPTCSLAAPPASPPHSAQPCSRRGRAEQARPRGAAGLSRACLPHTGCSAGGTPCGLTLPDADPPVGSTRASSGAHSRVLSSCRSQRC